jgi:hypothetical protein
MRSKCAPYREAGEIRDRTTEAALPNRWAQFIDCGDHLLEYRPSWSCRHGAAERRLDVPLNFFPTYPHWAGRTFY